MNDWSLLEISGAGGYIKVVFEQKEAKEHVDIEVIYSSSGELKGLVIIELMKNYKIKYMTGIKHKDGITVPIYKYKSIPCRSTRRYHGSMYALAGLAACPRDLIDYLCERMDSNNIVFSNAKVRDNFKDIIYKVSGFETVYQDATIKRAFHALVKKNLLIRGDKRGTYIVNPLYYSKNENKERIQLIENLVREDLLKFKS